MQDNGVHPIKIVLYHPAFNCLVEKEVQTFKVAMKKQTEGAGDQAVEVSVSLLHYPSCHNWPVSSQVNV